MATAKSYLPEGLGNVTAHLVVKNALEAIEFYKAAFGAELHAHAPGPLPGSTMHAAIRIGNTMVFLADDMSMSALKAPGNLGAATSSLVLYVTDCDAVFNRAVAAGAKVNMPIADQFWGDRYGKVIDPAGHVWEIATHKEDLTAEELGQRAQAAMAAFGKPA